MKFIKFAAKLTKEQANTIMSRRIKNAESRPLAVAFPWACPNTAPTNNTVTKTIPTKTKTLVIIERISNNFFMLKLYNVLQKVDFYLKITRFKL